VIFKPLKQTYFYVDMGMTRINMRESNLLDRYEWDHARGVVEGALPVTAEWSKGQVNLLFTLGFEKVHPCKIFQLVSLSWFTMNNGE
jgi:hypothetical protein